ncbi:MAG: PilN domain-containing protein [Wenzhouxiangellaceae bacterium]|nr:PilN domain-containing protein [Wenzhouxiangellaceae bacterium]
MRRINLLPWREELRQERQRNFLILLLAGALLAAGCVFLVTRIYDARIENQDDRNQFLQAEIVKLDRKIARIDRLDETRSRLLERKRVIEDLQANRTLMVRLFDQLVRTVPSGIRLLNVEQTANQLTINGTSQSQARVSNYLRSLDDSPILHDPRLRIIESEVDETDSQMPFGFSVDVTLAPPEASDENQPESDGEATSP